MEKEPKWGRETGDVTVDTANRVWVNAGEATVTQFPCIAGCGTISFAPSNPERPDWGFLCSKCANAPARRASQNSKGFSVLHAETAEEMGII